jgi:Tfp pilus assembly protein FimT
MTESLVVIVIVGMTVVIAIPLIAERVRSARIQVATKQFVVDLRAARLKAVSIRSSVDVAVSADPVNSYRFTDSRGRDHQVQLPEGVRIANSNALIQFRSNGSVLGGASTVLETNLSKYESERWTVTTSVLGITRATQARFTP